ncbi:MAG: enoyl-CoA hydratase-related protein [Dehalococcoidia bacterium]
MTQYETIEVDRSGRVGIIRLSRPDVLNAFNATMYREWGHAADAFNADPAIGAIVTTGNGRAYSSGADIGGFERTFTGGPGNQEEGSRSPFDPDRLAASKPLIAAVDGVAVGIGLTSILWFDRIVASTQARFSMRFAAIGLTPELNSQWLLPRLIGLHNAKEMMLTGRIYSAAEAKELGLVRHVVEPDELMPTAIALAAEVAANPIETLRAIKGAIHQDMQLTEMAQTEKRSTALFGESRKTAVHREALLAIRERRAPRFHDAAHMATIEAMIGTS